jgi:serine phosphatase RsbU (regulator of sigma subunit)
LFGRRRGHEQASEEFTTPRLIEVVRESASEAAENVQRIISAVAEHRASFPPNDDTTVVVVKID